MTQKRWDKTRAISSEVGSRLGKESAELDAPALRSDRGFLVYVSRTYPSMVPYLKGFHLTIESWRPGSRRRRVEARPGDEREDKEDWEEDDWRHERDELYGWEVDKGRDDLPDDYHGPDKVVAVPRLVHDLACLEKLTEPEEPPRQVVRSKHILVALYGAGDASGDGFCFAVDTKAKGVKVRLGTWGKDEEDEHSTWMELNNLVEGVEELVKTEHLTGAELFVATDNFTCESAYHRGTSSNKRLFGLILRLRTLELHNGLIIHIIHFAGTRMIFCGIDGGSRGDMNEGILGGQDIMSYFRLSEIRDRAIPGRPRLGPGFHGTEGPHPSHPGGVVHHRTWHCRGKTGSTWNLDP